MARLATHSPGLPLAGAGAPRPAHQPQAGLGPQGGDAPQGAHAPRRLPHGRRLLQSTLRRAPAHDGGQDFRVWRHPRAPRSVRTDNESVFTSKTFRLALFLLGIGHQRTDPHRPWQNGRVERLFGTLKSKLDRLAVDSAGALSQALVEFRFFYNHVRPHQNLGGATPAEAWAGIDPYARTKGEYWFEGWDGLLQGYYLRR